MGHKQIELVGRTAILAAIYNPDHLPSAVLDANSSSPFCLHCLRENGLAFFEGPFMHIVRRNNNVEENDDKKDEELVVRFTPFFEDHPNVRTYVCTGCGYGEKTEGHMMRDSETACTKTTEECA